MTLEVGLIAWLIVAVVVAIGVDRGLDGIGGAVVTVVTFFVEFSNFEAEAFLLSLPITVQKSRMTDSIHIVRMLFEGRVSCFKQQCDVSLL